MSFEELDVKVARAEVEDRIKRVMELVRKMSDTACDAAGGKPFLIQLLAIEGQIEDELNGFLP